MALVEISHLTKVFYPARPFGAWLRAPWRQGPPVVALQDVSLTIEPGELLCLMGPNGAGKTTLLKTLVGLVLPTSGEARVLDHPVRHPLPARARARIGFASSERPGFYDQLTGRQNLAFFARLYGLGRATAARRIDELCGQFGLEAPDRQYQEYPAGMKQRLLLARALLHDPPLLLLDEPARSLDPAQTDKLHAFLREQCRRKGKTVLLTTHQVWEAERLAGRIAVLSRGALQACGTREELARAGGLAMLLHRQPA